MKYKYLHIYMFIQLITLIEITKTNWLLSISFFYLIFIYYRYEIKILLITIIILFIVSLINNINSSFIISNQYEHIGKVIKTFDNSLIIKEDKSKYFLYGLDTSFYLPGDKISFNGYYKSINQDKNMWFFLESHKCIGEMNVNYDVELISNGKSFRSNLLRELINDKSNYSNITLAFLYKKKTNFNINLFDYSNMMGISHLIVISGFHIILINKFIEKGLFSLNIKKKYIKFISYFVLVYFLYLIYFPWTGIRALIYIIILENSCFNKYESLFITAILFVIFNPTIMLTNSMILSFGISFIFIQYSNKNNNFNNYLLFNFKAFIFTLPIICSWENNVNLFSPLISILLTPIIELIYVFILLTLPFQFLWKPIGYILSIFLIFFEILKYFYIPILLNPITLECKFIFIFTYLQYISNLQSDQNLLFITFGIILFILFI